jgi:hypothetical protein
LAGLQRHNSLQMKTDAETQKCKLLNLPSKSQNFKSLQFRGSLQFVESLHSAFRHFNF